MDSYFNRKGDASTSVLPIYIASVTAETCHSERV